MLAGGDQPAEAADPAAFEADLQDFMTRYRSLSLREIGAQLERMRERTPRGNRQWSASSVKKQLDLAWKAGLAVPALAKASSNQV